jgi:hypothetical protein
MATYPLNLGGRAWGLDMVMLVFPVMAETGVKEPFVASRAAIRLLKQHMAKNPIFEADSSRMEELFAATIGTTRASIA